MSMGLRGDIVPMTPIEYIINLANNLHLYYKPSEFIILLVNRWAQKELQNPTSSVIDVNKRQEWEVAICAWRVEYKNKLQLLRNCNKLI